MSRKQKRRTFTLDEPYEIECEYTFGGFNLRFKAWQTNGEEHTFIVKMHFCDLAQLAKKLWGVIADRKSKINMVETALRNSQ